MSTKNSTPQTRNLLGNFNHRLVIDRLPNVSFFCQSVNIPSLTLGEAIQPTPFIDIKKPGDKIIFEPLQVIYKVDENLTNYRELRNWIIGLGRPETFEQYRRLRAGEDRVSFPSNSDRLAYSDATVIVTSNKLNPIKSFKFYDLWPSSLGEIAFNTDNSDVEYITGDATFNYMYYDLV